MKRAFEINSIHVEYMFVKHGCIGVRIHTWVDGKSEADQTQIGYAADNILGIQVEGLQGGAAVMTITLKSGDMDVYTVKAVDHPNKEVSFAFEHLRKVASNVHGTCGVLTPLVLRSPLEKAITLQDLCSVSASLRSCPRVDQQFWQGESNGVALSFDTNEGKRYILKFDEGDVLRASVFQSLENDATGRTRTALEVLVKGKNRVYLFMDHFISEVASKEVKAAFEKVCGDLLGYMREPAKEKPANQWVKTRSKHPIVKMHDLKKGYVSLDLRGIKGISLFPEEVDGNHQPPADATFVLTIDIGAEGTITFEEDDMGGYDGLKEAYDQLHEAWENHHS